MNGGGFVPSGHIGARAAKLVVYRHLFKPTQFDSELHAEIQGAIDHAKQEEDRVKKDGFSALPKAFQTLAQRTPLPGKTEQVKSPDDAVALFLNQREATERWMRSVLESFSCGRTDFCERVFPQSREKNPLPEFLTRLVAVRRHQVLNRLQHDLFDGRVRAFFVSVNTGTTPFPNRFIWADQKVINSFADVGAVDPFFDKSHAIGNKVKVLFNSKEMADVYPLKRFDPNPDKRRTTKTERVEGIIMSLHDVEELAQLGVRQLQREIKNTVNEDIPESTVRRARNNLRKRNLPRTHG